MRTVDVSLAERSYPIHIGSGLLGRGELFAPYFKKSKRAIVVTNEVVAPLHLNALLSGLDAAGVQATSIVLPDGEAFKSWETLNQIFTELLSARAERSTTLIALGGGVIGDMTGFAAACYQRGVPFIQLPTTLLSQVDSSVGGKTAVNHPLGKNMIGAFYQPRLVIADTDTLKTLPDRELKAGLAEVIKYGFIRDLPFLEWIEQHLPALLAGNPEALAYAVERSCINKAEVVAADETEQGERATLNLGHTFGHAIETGLGYGEWLHGEAVAAGTVMAADLSARLGLISEIEVMRVRCVLQAAGLPVSGPKLSSARYIELMRHDKKVQAGKLRLILLQHIGHAIIHDGATEEQIAASIEACCA